MGGPRPRVSPVVTGQKVAEREGPGRVPYPPVPQSSLGNSLHRCNACKIPNAVLRRKRTGNAGGLTAHSGSDQPSCLSDTLRISRPGLFTNPVQLIILFPLHLAVVPSLCLAVSQSHHAHRLTGLNQTYSGTRARTRTHACTAARPSFDWTYASRA